MVEHNPPPSADSPRPPVIPLPIALYVSGELIFELYDGGQPTRRIFDPLGQARASEGKRARGGTRVPKRVCAHAKISARVPGPA